MMPSSPICPACGAANPPQAAFCNTCGQALAGRSGPQTGLLPATHLLKQRYQILAQVGRGGFAAVYQAEDTQLGNRLVAIKEMSQHGLAPQELAQAIDAFQREALLLAGLKHPNLPAIYDQFQETGRHYLVMEFIIGQTLEDYLAKHGGKLPAAEALQIGQQLCNVLHYLHTRQPPIIFRDLKPSNVMRSAEGQLYLIDFGIARHFKPGQMKDTIAFGSPGYAAPEQYGKAQTDARSDLYSLGAMLHQMLSGHDPSETPFRFPPLDSSTPGELDALIAQMVEINEGKRPTSAAAISQSLASIADALSAAQQPPAPVAAQPAPSPQPAPTMPAAYSLSGKAIPSRPAKAIPAEKPPHPIVHSTYEHHSGWAWDVAWSPDGKYLASASEDKTVQVWNPVTMQTVATYRGHTNDVFAVAWSPNGKQIASASADGTVQVWEPYSGKQALICKGHTNAVIGLDWASDGGALVSCSIDETVRIWNAVTGLPPIPSNNYTRHVPAQIHSVAWSPDRTRVAFGGEDGFVRIWRLGVNDVYVLMYHGHLKLVGALSWSPDGKQIASASVDGTVQVWDSVTGYRSATYTGHEGIVYTVAWSPDGQCIASGGLDKTVHIWSPSDPGHTISLYQEHTGAVRSVAWSPDGHYIASGSLDKTVQVWQPTR